MATIRNEADLIDLLENSQEYRRAVLRWIAYKEPIDLSADAIANEAVENSLAAVLASGAQKTEEHSATLARLDALIAEVVEMQRRFEARVIVSESRAGNDWGYALERRLADDYNGLIRGVGRFGRVRLVRDASGKAQTRDRDIVAYEDDVEAAMDEGRIAIGDDSELARADLICYGLRAEAPNRMWFVGEASSVIDANDIVRARRWADILQKIYPADAAMPFAYGVSVTDSCEALAQEADVRLFLVEEPKATDAMR